MVRITRRVDPDSSTLEPLLYYKVNQPAKYGVLPTLSGGVQFRRTVYRPFRKGWKGVCHYGPCAVFIASITLLVVTCFIFYNAVSHSPVRSVRQDTLPLTNLTVAVPSSLCKHMAEEVLNRRGSTVDAAILAALCSGVVNSYASGLGGGAFMLIKPSIHSTVNNKELSKLVDEKKRSFNRDQPVMIDCRETAPGTNTPQLIVAAATPGMFMHRNATYGGLASGVSKQGSLIV